jgi:hypothetical protein
MSFLMFGTDSSEPYAELFESYMRGLFGQRIEPSIYTWLYASDIDFLLETLMPDAVVFCPLNNVIVPPCAGKTDRISDINATLGYIAVVRHLPVVAFSGLTDIPGHCEKVLQAGALACLPLPFKPGPFRQVFERVIAEVLRNRRTAQCGNKEGGKR